MNPNPFASLNHFTVPLLRNLQHLLPTWRYDAPHRGASGCQIKKPQERRLLLRSFPTETTNRDADYRTGGNHTLLPPACQAVFLGMYFRGNRAGVPRPAGKALKAYIPPRSRRLQLCRIQHVVEDLLPLARGRHVHQPVLGLDDGRIGIFAGVRFESGVRPEGRLPFKPVRAIPWTT